VTVGGLDVRALGDGPLGISAVVKDAAGNVSVAVTAQVTKDTVAPAAPTAYYIDGPNNLPDGIVGLAEPGATVSAVRTSPAPSGPYTAVANASGQFGMIVAATKTGPVSYSVTATDAAGNVGPATVVPDSVANMAEAFATDSELDSTGKKARAGTDDEPVAEVDAVDPAAEAPSGETAEPSGTAVEAATSE